MRRLWSLLWRDGVAHERSHKKELDLPEAFSNDVNRKALAFAMPRSAHGDVSGLLLQSVRPLPEAAIYCADPSAFRSVFVYRDNVVFAFAEGMKGVSLRMPEGSVADAIAQGAVDRGELGDGWVLLPLFAEDGRFLAELPILMRAAYEAAT
ncbi:hypothetical protein NDN16_18635 [Aureimonas altamirensis]|uniref:SseB protein N-terminal domain-containing protein n=1 Tax=Sphingomonas taxi TaxID=1549858 RepID=A0A2W5AUN1_9SPHN|nr:hypothetical protein [Aureimonas altamirensis]MCM2505684.1 hypothetical protein [Aureimonas altamirensis]PZO71728.1 MAG: hypothetical protein DI640_14085 [Sphingomonas taxi]